MRGRDKGMSLPLVFLTRNRGLECHTPAKISVKLPCTWCRGGCVHAVHDCRSEHTARLLHAVLVASFHWTWVSGL